MPNLRTTFACAILATCILGSSATAARAEYYVPPGNSAVNQYTQNEPSAGGEKGQREKPVVAAEALGGKNAKKLEEKGSAGKAAAELSAATDPRPLEPEASEPKIASEEEVEESTSPPSADRTKKHKQKKPAKSAHHYKQKQKNLTQPTTGGNGGQPPRTESHEPEPGGASASGELIAHATGLSGGTLGIFLPLVILAAIAAAIAFVWRNRRNDGQPLG